MRLATTLIRQSDLPALAWCLRLDGLEGEATVFHGSGVETRGHAFVEGAWDGDFATMRPDAAVFLAGSGGRIGADVCQLFAPSHTLEAVYTVGLGKQWFASNSLAFLLQMTSLELDPDYPAYLLDLRTVTRGLKRFERRIRTRTGPPVERHYACNLRVTRAANGQWCCEVCAKPQPPVFGTFAAYVAFLRTTLGALFENAVDTARQRGYRPLATVSSGYDSTACATLVAGLGCRDAITIRDASWGAASNDSGVEVGRRLGLDVTEAGGRDYLQRPGMPEAEFVALGDTGDVQLAAFEEQLPGRILITGFHGDKMWDPHAKHPGPDIVRGDASGSSLAEFRYRVGFLHVPVPFIACQRHADIQKISSDDEMTPWSVGGDYDRPLPRRIAEEGGVPRTLFGQKKAATAIWWTLVPPSEASSGSYRAYRDRHRRGAIDPGYWLHALAYGCSRVWERAASLLYRITRKLGFGVRLRQIVPYRYTEPPGEAQLVQWGVSQVRQRYASGPGQIGRHQVTIRRSVVESDGGQDGQRGPT